MNDMATDNENRDRVLKKKRKYKAPHLLVYGEMTVLTAGGSGPMVEGGGMMGMGMMGMNPNRRP